MKIEAALRKLKNAVIFGIAADISGQGQEDDNVAISYY